jgi:hypothetical protein
MEEFICEILSTNFKGIWISPKYGGFNPKKIDRFKPELPADQLYENIIKKSGEFASPPTRPHQYAEPQWITKEEFEKEYGKVEYIRIKDPNDYTIYDIIIWTDKYVITLSEYDGYEYFVVLPRNPPKRGDKNGTTPC